MDTVRNLLNRSSPVDAMAKTGDVLTELIAFVNKQVSGQNNVMTVAAILAKKAGASPTVKSSGAFQAFVNGGLQNKSADTDMAAIAGTLADTKFAGWVFYIGADGTLSVSAKTADRASAALVVADIGGLSLPDNKAIIGYIVVQNAQGSGTAFTAGTTALDATGVTLTFVNATAVTLSLTTLEDRTAFI